MYLVLHDSTHGPLFRDRHVSDDKIYPTDEHTISINRRTISLISERDPIHIPWSDFDVEYVVECTGQKAVTPAPSPDAPTFVFKFNTNDYINSKKYDVISCASCTTNCITPIAKILNNAFAIQQGFLTTVHASTRSQYVLDGYRKKNKRSGRAVLGNIILTTTGAAKAISAVLPELTGKLTGISVRVPTNNVSMTDLTLNTPRPTSMEEILSTFRKASTSDFEGVVEVVDEELVSCDFLGNPCSAVIDAPACVELNPQFFKTIAWYDNEWAYSTRLLDILSFMANEESFSV